MSLPAFEYVAPKSLRRALSAQREGGVYLGGGTDLFVAMKQRIRRPELVIDLSALSGLKRIRWDRNQGLRIGAMTTLTHLKEDPLVRRHLPAFDDIIGQVSTPQLQNMGTLGGNLCLDTRCTYYNQPLFLKKRWEPCFKIGGSVCHVVRGGNACLAVYSGDLAAPLMALGARVKVAGPEYARELALKDFFSGSGINPNILKFNEILTEIVIPALPGHAGLSYRKLRLRDTIDFPLLGIAAFVHLEGKGGRCLDFRLIMGAVSSAPIAVEEAGEVMRGKTVTSERIEEICRIAGKSAHPVANTASEPGYRRRMIDVLTRNAVHEALERIL